MPEDWWNHQRKPEFEDEYIPEPQNKPTRKCPACGIELGDVMMYSCPRNPCPAGLGSKSFLAV